MSADNYWIIRRTPASRYVPLMGFASEELTPRILTGAREFDTVEDALAAIDGEWSEYGTSVHPECRLDEDAWLTSVARSAAAAQRLRDHLDILALDGAAPDPLDLVDLAFGDR